MLPKSIKEDWELYREFPIHWLARHSKQEIPIEYIDKYIEESYGFVKTPIETISVDPLIMRVLYLVSVIPVMCKWI